jgi:hypothetical protein
MTNDTEFIKNYAIEHKLTYKEAKNKCKQEYKEIKPNGAKVKTKKQAEGVVRIEFGSFDPFFDM